MCSLRFPSRAASAISSEQEVCFAVDHPITLTDDRLSDGLSQMTFAGPWWT